LVGLANLFNSL